MNDECRPGTGEAIESDSGCQRRSLRFRPGSARKFLIANKWRIPDHCVCGRRGSDIKKVSRLDAHARTQGGNSRTSGVASRRIKLESDDGLALRGTRKAQSLYSLPRSLQEYALSAGRLNNLVARRANRPGNQIFGNLRRRVERTASLPKRASDRLVPPKAA